MRFAILGPLMVHDGESQIDVPKGRQRVLLAALLVHAGTPVAADALAEVVWDESPPPSADVTLRSHVLRLRRVLGPRAGARLVTRHPGYLLQAGEDEVDLLQFRYLCQAGGAALREGAWRRADQLLGKALGLWRGPPLADIPSESLRRDDVQYLEALRLQAEEWRADAALRLGRHDELVPGLQSLAARHPLRERLHAQLILALYRCGRQAEALAAYQHARDTLVEELGVEPGPELRKLHQRLLSTDPALAFTGPGREPGLTGRPIVGRAVELELMSVAYARAVAGQSQVMLVTGEAGIGKTRLVEELCGRILSAADGAQVRVGESAPLAGVTLAFGPFVAALGDQGEWLLAGDGEGDMLAARHRLFLRVLQLLAGLAARSPLVLVLEDLHWADESSRELLGFLAVRLRSEPVLLVGTLREEELAAGIRGWLAELERGSGVTRLRLGPLADAEIAGLVDKALPPGADADHVAAVVRAAEGNPLYARELAAAGPHMLPPSISEAVLARVAGLDAGARAVVEQVCVADGGLPHELLSAALRLAEESLLAAVRQAGASGLLITGADGYALRHEVIRQVVYADLMVGERQRLHRRQAETLAARPGSDPGRLAQHWHLAGCPDRAGPAAVSAARAAVRARAYPEALRCYVLALELELEAWVPESGPALLEEAARTASWAGDPRRAADWTAQALAQSGPASPPIDRARLLERLGRYQWEAGDLRSAVDSTGQAIVLLGDDPPSELQACVLAAHATLLRQLAEFDAALPLAERAVAVARQVNAVAAHAESLTTLGIIQGRRGELDAGLAALRTSFDLARQAGSVDDVARAASSHMYLLCTAGRFTEALEVARSGRAATDLLGTPTAVTSLLDNNTVAVLIYTGRWQEADRLLDELVARSSGYAATYLRLRQLELAVGQGEQQRAADLAAALGKLAEDKPAILGPLHGCLAEQALYAGDLLTAAEKVLTGLAALASATRPADEIRLLAAGARVAADLALLPVPAGRRGLGDQWVRSAATFTDRAQAIADLHSAGQQELAPWNVLVAAERARECRTDSWATWRVAAQAWHEADQPYREAYARLREAEAAARAGHREQAADALTACGTLAGSLPSGPLLTMARDLAQRARLTDRSHMPSLSANAQLPCTCPDFLTNLDWGLAPPPRPGPGKEDIDERAGESECASHVLPEDPR
jgi:DNA-binding SARP family transcriptional activator